MIEPKFMYKDLKRLQALPLDQKIILSKLRIAEWYQFWNGYVYVSYSGGKDSTVLLKLVRELYPDVPAVYVDTRLDFPEVRVHVKNTDNVIWLKPTMNFRAVIDEYGFCYPSKDVAQLIESYRRGTNWGINSFVGKDAKGNYKPFKRRFIKWKWLADSDIKISPKCCEIMKEKPLARFSKESGRKPYTGLLAAESFRRTLSWKKTGCNAFNTQKPSSKPLSFWTEQDVLRYIADNDITISSVYGNIVTDKTGRLKCTGEFRTGCIFCPIGAHLDKINKFQRLKESHPQLYRYCMAELGLDDFLNKVGVEH